MSFEQWVDLVRTFQSALPRSKKDSSKFAREYEPARLAAESEGEGAIGSWSDIEAEDAEAEGEGEYEDDGQDDYLAESAEVFEVGTEAVAYTHLRAHVTVLGFVCRHMLEKNKMADKKPQTKFQQP